MWRRIWNDIKEYFGNGINFYQKDILELVDIITRHSWISDVLIFQYVFSDMYKNSSTIEINQFIDKLATFLNACGEKPIYILCNDINLSKSYNGGREFFDVLESKISNPKIVRRMLLITTIKTDILNMGMNIKGIVLFLMTFRMK